MPRHEAEEIVASVTVKIGQYSAVPWQAAGFLMGDRIELLRKDPIRNLGPTPETVYPWNVVDYLNVDNPKK